MFRKKVRSEAEPGVTAGEKSTALNALSAKEWLMKTDYPSAGLDESLGFSSRPAEFALDRRIPLYSGRQGWRFFSLEGQGAGHGNVFRAKPRVSARLRITAQATMGISMRGMYQ